VFADIDAKIAVVNIATLQSNRPALLKTLLLSALASVCIAAPALAQMPKPSPSQG
jgi:hypothetical protein